MGSKCWQGGGGVKSENFADVINGSSLKRKWELDATAGGEGGDFNQGRCKPQQYAAPKLLLAFLPYDLLVLDSTAARAEHFRSAAALLSLLGGHQSPEDRRRRAHVSRSRCAARGHSHNFFPINPCLIDATCQEIREKLWIARYDAVAFGANRKNL